MSLQYTAPYRHEGAIELQMRVLLDMVRTVLADSGLAESHWVTVAESAVYVLNCCHRNSWPLTELTGVYPLFRAHWLLCCLQGVR